MGENKMTIAKEEQKKFYICNDCGEEFHGEHAFQDAYEHLNSTDDMGEFECHSFREVEEK